MKEKKKSKYTTICGKLFKILNGIIIALMFILGYIDMVPIEVKAQAFDFAYEDYKGVIINTCNATNKHMYYLQKRFDDLPKAITENFLNDGYQIVVADKLSVENTNLEELGYDEAAGLYSQKQKRISLAYESDSYVLCHEMAHYYSKNFGLLEGEIKEIYDDGTEPQRLCKLEYSDYASTSLGEYYAESFLMYYKDGAVLRLVCPKTYKCIDHDVKNAENIIKEFREKN